MIPRKAATPGGRRVNIWVKSPWADKMRKYPTVNWSAVATEAFRKAILMLEKEA